MKIDSNTLIQEVEKMKIKVVEIKGKKFAYQETNKTLDDVINLIRGMEKEE